MKFLFYLLTVLLLLMYQSCDSFPNHTDNNDSKNVITDNTTKIPSIIGKWYYKAEDDRYYYDFKSNGTIWYSYYQHAPSGSSLNTFVTITGTWSYLNEEKTTFEISWNDSIPCWYDILSEDSEKLYLRINGKGPSGRGLATTTLLKSAKKIIYTIDDALKPLIGTWYYDKTKDGKRIQFKEDGTCYCTYYQYVGSSTLSSLNGWVTRKGSWHYSVDNMTISVTMESEITYTYIISDLSSTSVTLKLPNKTPAGTSIIYSSTPLNK